MNIITKHIKKEREYSELLQVIKNQSTSRIAHPARFIGLCEGAKNALISALCEDTSYNFSENPMLLIVSDEKEMMKSYNALSELGLSAVLYRYRDFVFYNITSSREYEHERLRAMTSIIENSCDIVITTADAALQYTIPQERLINSIMTVSSDDTVEIEKLKAFFIDSGYVFVDMVDGIGQFSIRGGIIDFFSPSSESPVRIELFGDEIDSMSYFDIISQRRTDAVTSIKITPAKEVIVNSIAREEIKKVIDSQLKKLKDFKIKDILLSEKESVLSNAELNFSDKYMSIIYPEKECLLDYFGAETIVICAEYSSITERISSYEWHQKQAVLSLLEDGVVPSSIAEYGKWSEFFTNFIASHAGVVIDTFMSSISNLKFISTFSIPSRQTVSYSENIDLLIDDISIYQKNKFTCIIICENELMAKNLKELLADRGLSAPVIRIEEEIGEGINLAISYGVNLKGFELPLTGFSLLSACSAANSAKALRIHSKKKTVKKRTAQEKIISYADLSAGDYVVHVNHGIGMFVGIESVTVEGVTRDYVKIKYAGTDLLYLPCDRLDSISKYIGAKSEDGTLKLSRMGGAEWGRAKNQVKTAAKQMAKELIKLYAERQRRPGFAFEADGDMQRDFENSFPFSETEGQLQAIKEIKEDMQLPRPMDRLLCGDVGFGKTEVALRAAFKAVESGKQVAVLVPTTILALQHYQTLISRLRGFPVRVDMLSRFRTAKQQQETLRKLRRGEIDILVGTHRIVSKDVLFKDLGLVIVDEEQRFGVSAKEKLKQLSSGVDTLTLTATPIPRTLNMAMSGIRDMSILEEAPHDRVPVQTYVLEYDDVIIAEAIKRELRRGGQVFYLNNRVESMQDILVKVSNMVPDAKISVAHGKMDKEELSDIWHDMISGEIDILISTTIIEAGVDVPNANTLIIENADRLGLSQLHQIRGRVGRSSRRAYAYFTYQRGRVLSDIATKRLSAIREYTEFGSGFKVALRDLEIRGAGNLLGAEQHGHMESVGYDMYMRILNEAILEEKGESVAQKVECAVEMNISAYIPERYIKNPLQRIDIYKKISFVETVNDTVDIIDELLDRYGELPQPVSALLDISLLRSLGSSCSLSKIQKKGSSVIFYPEKFNQSTWFRLAAEKRGCLLISLELKPYITLKIKKGENASDAAIDLLNFYLKIENEIKTEENEKEK